jgi:predicted transcriptional regulator of viral defense system
MLKSAGTLESIKKGLYIAGSGLHSARPESSLMANHILGPSYVSMDTALAFYGLVPERM